MTRNDLQEAILQCLTKSGKAEHWSDVAKYIWENFESDLRKSDKLFYTWQYDIRWAMQRLRDAGQVRSVGKGQWEKC